MQHQEITEYQRDTPKVNVSSGMLKDRIICFPPPPLPLQDNSFLPEHVGTWLSTPVALWYTAVAGCRVPKFVNNCPLAFKERFPNKTIEGSGIVAWSPGHQT
jgi:hypothetical protein